MSMSVQLIQHIEVDDGRFVFFPNLSVNQLDEIYVLDRKLRGDVGAIREY